MHAGFFIKSFIQRTKAILKVQHKTALQKITGLFLVFLNSRKHSYFNSTEVREPALPKLILLFCQLIHQNLKSIPPHPTALFMKVKCYVSVQRKKYLCRLNTYCSEGIRKTHREGLIYQTGSNRRLAFLLRELPACISQDI